MEYRILRRTEDLFMTGLATSTLYEMMEKGEFPKPINFVVEPSDGGSGTSWVGSRTCKSTLRTSFIYNQNIAKIVIKKLWFQSQISPLIELSFSTSGNKMLSDPNTAAELNALFESVKLLAKK